MSQADNLLDTLSVDYTDESYITVNDDRTITVPDELKRIAVQGDHNIETVTIDCPRYWDEYDFSTMKVYINYMRPDGYKDSYRTKNLRVAEDDDTRILFDWTISGNVTAIKGNLSFLVYIESTKANPCWHSRLNQQMIIDEGLSATEQILRAPDSIEQVLAQTTSGYIAEAKAEIEGKTAQSLASIPEDYTTVNDMAEEALREKANIIKMEAEGEAITVSDSADNALLGLKLFGKTMQVSTTGKNLARNELYTMKTNGLSIVVHDDKSFTVNGTATAGTFLTIHTDFNPGTGDYILTGCPSSGGVSKYILYMTDSESGFYAQDAGSGYTFTHPGNIAPDLRLAVYEGVTVDNALFRPMIRSAAVTDDTYEPYSGGVASPSPDWPQALKSIETQTVEIYGKNLLQPKANKSSGYTAVVNEDGSVTVTGAATTTNAIYLTIATCSMENPIVLDRSLKYYMWGESSNGKYIGTKTLDSNGDAAWSTVSTWNKHVGTDYMTIVQLYLESSGHAVGDTSLCGTYRFQLEVGDSFTGYEGYKDSRSITFQRSLPGIPVPSGGNYTDSDGQQWICDEIDFERGVYVQRIKQLTFDGSETWGTSGGQYLYHDLMDHAIEGGEGFCSHFDFWYNYGGDCVFASEKWFYLGNVATQRFNLDVATWKAYLADNPVTVNYILATPIETPLTDAELASFKMVRSNYPSTTVLNDSGAHIAIKYAADTKTYVDKSNRNAGTRRQPDWSRLKWYVMGDSLTDPAGGIHTDKFYYEYIAEKTGIQVIVDGLGGTGYYAGVSEEKNFADRVENIPADVDIVTIFGSGNDVKHASVEEYKAGMSKVMGYFFNNRPGLPVIIVPPSPWKTYNKRSDEWKGYCDMLELMALNFSLHYMGEMWTAPPFDPHSTAACTTFFSKCADGIHPDENGHRALASYFYNAMNKILAFRNLGLDDEA